MCICIKKKKNLDDCVICLSNCNEKYITLKCGHYFHLFCIQRSLYEYIIEYNYSLSCPLCRTNINMKDLVKIFSKWLFIDYFPSVWKNKNTVDLINFTIHSKKKYKISKINLNNNHSVLIPTFKKTWLNKLFYVPVFIHSPFIYNLIVNENNSLQNIQLYNNFEFLKKYKFIIEGNFYNDSNWKKFLKNLIKLKKYNINNNYIKNTNLVKHYNISENFIQFYIKDLTDVTTIDSEDGSYFEHFVYKRNRRSKVLFKTFILNIHDNIFLINEMFKIMYY